MTIDPSGLDTAGWDAVLDILLRRPRVPREVIKLRERILDGRPVRRHHLFIFERLEFSEAEFQQIAAANAAQERA